MTEMKMLRVSMFTKHVLRTVAVVAALSFACPANAKFYWGVKGGVNMADNDLSALKGMPMEEFANVDNYVGFFIGPKAEFRIPILGLGVEAAALYSQKGMFVGDRETFMQNSILIPLNVKLAIGLGNVANVFVAAGPELGFNVGETAKIFDNVTWDDVTGAVKGGVSAYVAEKSTLSFNVGVGVTLLNHLQVGLNYNMPWGMTGSFQYIDASELENVENIRNGQDITMGAFEKLSGTVDKTEQATANIKAGTLQVSVAYLF